MKKDGQRLEITPETRLGPLLDQFPQLEEILIGMAPAFARLRNPLLRKTVAKVATLRQVAATGNVPLSDLIRTLREAAGVEAGSLEFAIPGMVVQEEPPAWFDPERIAGSLDIRPLLDSGVHPMSRVMNDLEALKPGAIYEVVSPFVPAPLLDAAAGKGFASWVRAEAPDLFRTYFVRSPG